jgi:transglutaminase-like putative cysteine protease
VSATASSLTASETGTDPRATEPWLATGLRTAVYVVSAAVLAFPLAVPEGVLGALAGAGAGALLGRALAATALRTHVVAIGAALALALGWALSQALVGSEALADAIGPSLALRLGDAVAFFAVTAPSAAALRCASVRRRALAILEAALVALAFASLVVSHRNGAIHRPYAIADPILERGGDPTVAVLIIGAMAAVVIGLLLLSEKSLLRSVVHVIVVFALLALVLFTTHVAGLPPPPPSGDGLALRDDTSQGGGHGGGGQGNQQGGPDFQDEYDQSGAQTPVAIILLHDDYSPPTGVYYFRQDAFSRYNGRRLVGAQTRGIDEDVAPGYPSRTTPIPDAPETGAFRTTVETTVGMLADHPRPFGLESPIALFPATNPDASRFRRVFRVRSAALTGDEWSLTGRRAGSVLWSPETLAHYTRGPDDPRYRELAERIVSALPERYRDDPYARALAITAWLGEHGTYSLRSRHAGAEDPTADFLFGDVTGYCVHFAHATVFLMRSIGLPARVATGYLSSESGRQGGSAILLSGQNSHAWPEVYLEGVGWVVVDVMPERALDPPPGTPDEELQQVLAELLRGNRIIPDDGSEPPAPITEIVASVRGFLTQALGLGLLVILVLAYAIKLWRAAAPLLASERDLARVSYRAALDRLAEAGVTRIEGESREAFAERLRARFPSLAALSRWAEASRFGGTVPTDLGTSARRARAGVASERARAVPLWRRALGALDPFSWLRVR